MEIRAIELTAKNRYYHPYPGTYMNALASIRHGPIIALTDIPGEEAITHLPLKEMTDILKGNTTARHAPHAPYLPPIYILNRKTSTPHISMQRHQHRQPKLHLIRRQPPP